MLKRILTYSLILIACFVGLFALSSCEPGRSELPDTQPGTNLSVEAIKTNVLVLETDEWRSGLYEEILDNQIVSATELDDKDRKALTKMLNEKYVDQLIRCGEKILNSSSCSSSHDKLNGIEASLNAVAPKLEGNYRKGDIAKLNSRIQKHKEMLGFSVAGSYSGAVTVNSYYDSSYDNDRRSKAASYRALNPPCTAIKSKISSEYVDRQLKNRRADFNAKLEKARSKASKSL